MNSQTPNEDHLEEFIDNIETRYDYSKLKDWELEKLRGREHLLHNEFQRFKMTFPDDGSIWQGKLRAVAADDSTEEKYPLTTAERLRLEDARKTAEGEVYRAVGHRKQLKREQRSDILNTVVDVSVNLKYASLSLFAAVKQLKPW